MRFLLRVIGTWFLGFALVLVVIDGVKTLAARAISVTPLADMWNALHAASWKSVSEAIISAVSPLSAQQIALFLFAQPGWAIFGSIGLVLLLLGRPNGRKKYVETY